MRRQSWLGWVLAVSWVTALCGCGTTDYSSTGGGVGGVGTVKVTSLAPATFPVLSATPFVLTGAGFLNVVGTDAEVTFSVSGGATPFAGGTSATATVPGTITSGTTISGTSPLATLCGSATSDVSVSVKLPTGATGTSAATVASFSAPTLAAFTPDPVRATISDPMTVTGAGFPAIGTVVNVRFSADVGTPFLAGTSAAADVSGEVISATTVQGFTPLAQTEDDFTGSVRIIFPDGSCTAGLPVSFTAPPVVRDLANLSAVLGDPTLQVFLSCFPTRALLTLDNLVNGAEAFFYDSAVGIGNPIGAGLAVPIVYTVNAGPTDDTLSVVTPTDPAQASDVLATLRVTNPDGQFGEFTTDPVTTDPIRFAVTGALAGTPFNLGAGVENAGVSVAVNPADPQNVVFAGHSTQSGSNTQILVSVTFDGGTTWTSSSVGGPGSDVTDGGGVALIRTGPRVAFDAFSNLYLAYAAGTLATILQSGDGGLTFPSFMSFINKFPSFQSVGLATGPSAVPGRELAIVTSLGSDQEVSLNWVASTGPGNFQPSPTSVPVSANVGVFQPQVTIGDAGDVYVTWVEPTLPGRTAVMLDADLDGPEGGADSFAGPDTTIFTNFGGPNFTSIEAAPQFGAPVGPEVAVIRAGAHAGRVVVTFTRNSTVDPANPELDAVAMVSDDFGASFSGAPLPAPVHPASSFDQSGLAIDADRTAPDGRILATWYDARNDAGNTRVERFAAASTDGLLWSAPVLLSGTGASDLSGAVSTDDYFHQGVSAVGGCAWAAWTHAVGDPDSFSVLAPFQIAPP